MGNSDVDRRALAKAIESMEAAVSKKQGFDAFVDIKSHIKSHELWRGAFAKGKEGFDLLQQSLDLLNELDKSK